MQRGCLVIDGHYETESSLGGEEWLVCGACQGKVPIPDGEVDYT